MNFFEKAQARAYAQDILGLTGHPDQDEIRAAYKKLAFEKHPDRGEGTADDFSRIGAAYSLLKDDKGYTAADALQTAPTDTGATTIRPKASRPSRVNVSEIVDGDAPKAEHVSPRRLRTALTSRICKINENEAQECRTLLDDIPFMAEPDPDEQSLRASILDVIKTTGAPHVPHTNHLPYAIRQSGRRISYMVSAQIEKGVNRVAVPTGAFTDNRKVLPIIVRFKAPEEGIGTHNVSAATLADSFPGAKSVRIHFAVGEWPKPAAAFQRAYA